MAMYAATEASQFQYTVANDHANAIINQFQQTNIINITKQVLDIEVTGQQIKAILKIPMLQQSIVNKAIAEQSQIKATEATFKHLPKNQQQRAKLRQAIQHLIEDLRKINDKKKEAQNQQKMQLLQLRLLMIDSCSEMSLLRLDHLQWIFKHYCTHIFKTGKHMTFQRLQYQKVHLTMERFFLFLRDFQLTLMKVGEKKQQVLDKNFIILLFKKVSSNCRDLSFQQFIRCLQKLAVCYFDQKQIYYKKKQKIKEQKQKRKQDYEKRKMQRMKKQKKNNQKQQKLQDQLENNEGEQNNKNQQMQSEMQKQSQVNLKEQQNDELIKDMMNDKELENPNQQINKITNRYALQQQNVQTLEEINQATQINEKQLFLLTIEQKIQYYYKFIIKVDSVKQYRDKITQLNLPIFQRGKSKTKQAGTNSQVDTNANHEESQRMEQLKKKMDEKKLKQKASPIPKPKEDGAWIKAEEQKKKKRQLKRQREVNAKQKSKQQSDAMLQKKIDSQKPVKQKKPEYNQKQIDWNSIGKMSIDQLKLNRFNPNKYYNKDDDDQIFLNQYQDGARGRVSSKVEIRQRNSVNIVEDVKKRVQEIQKKEKRQQKQLQKKVGQNIPIKGRF